MHAKARNILQAALVASLLATCGADCSSLTSNPPERSTSSPERYDDRSSSSSDRDVDRYFSFDGSVRIPKKARGVAEGKGELKWTADRDGTVYVADLTDHRAITEKQVDKGETIVLDPKDDRVRIGGRTVAKYEFDNKNKHKIYFERD